MTAPVGYAKLRSWDYKKNQPTLKHKRFFKYRMLILTRLWAEAIWWTGMLYNFVENANRRSVQKYYEKCYNDAHAGAVTRHKWRMNKCQHPPMS